MKKLCAVVFLLILLSSCNREDPFPKEPSIAFVSFEKTATTTGIDNGGNLTFSFQDGDGNIGLDATDLESPFDTSSVYYYNFFCTYYEKQNGEFVEIELPLSLNARIPRLSEEEEESIEGTITLPLAINNPLSSFDTIRFDFYIVDRALNHSNIVTTPEIIVNKKSQ